MTAFKPPTLDERLGFDIDAMVRTLLESDPRVKKIESSIRSRLQSAVREVRKKVTRGSRGAVVRKARSA